MEYIIISLIFEISSQWECIETLSNDSKHGYVNFVWVIDSEFFRNLYTVRFFYRAT